MNRVTNHSRKHNLRSSRRGGVFAQQRRVLRRQKRAPHPASGHTSAGVGVSPATLLLLSVRHNRGDPTALPAYKKNHVIPHPTIVKSNTYRMIHTHNNETLVRLFSRNIRTQTNKKIMRAEYCNTEKTGTHVRRRKHLLRKKTTEP